jgi:hypothetical protein
MITSQEKERYQQQDPVFTSQENLLKSLPKIMAGLSGLRADIMPIFKMSMKEYEDMDIK